MATSTFAAPVFNWLPFASCLSSLSAGDRVWGPRLHARAARVVCIRLCVAHGEAHGVGRSRAHFARTGAAPARFSALFCSIGVS